MEAGWTDSDGRELKQLLEGLGVTGKPAFRDALNKVKDLVERHGSDGYGDKPDDMSRVAYWFQHLDTSSMLPEGSKPATAALGHSMV